MTESKWKQTVTWILFVELIGVLSGLISMQGMENFQEIVKQPVCTPPAIVFPIVWTLLYALMGYSTAKIAQTASSPHRSKALNLFIIQLIVNFFWSPIFFNGKVYGFAFIWLIILCILAIYMFLSFRKVDPSAAYLQIPYLLWLMFAAYLNYAVWILNK